MYSSKDLQEIINNHFDAIHLDHKPIELFDPIKYVLSIGGKRVRPVLTLMACNVFNESIEKAINAAIGVEIFHNFTLLHDDIMDHAELRRNRQTVHVKWDENRAILSGDAMSILAYEYMTKSDDAKLKKILPVFNKTALEVCQGQQYDINFEQQNDVNIEDYLEMIKLKTAVLIAGSLKIGAILGGASNKNADYIYEFGKNIGLAFQLQDDLLDSFGETQKFGKNIGGDILENKKTFLLLKAFDLAERNHLKVLRKNISGKKLNPEVKIREVLTVYKDLNIKEITEDKINSFFTSANSCLEKIEIDKSRKLILKEFTEQLIGRTY